MDNTEDIQPEEQPDDDPRPENTVDLDGLNLEQALIDFEVANARVLDLTRRLTEMSQQLSTARNELEDTKIRLRLSESRLADVEGSRGVPTG